MRGFIKGCLKLALMALLVGVTLLVIIGLLGGKGAFTKTFTNTEDRGFHIVKFIDKFEFAKKFGANFFQELGKKDASGEKEVAITDHMLQGNYDTLKIDLGACAFYIEESEDEHFYLHENNMDKLKVKEDGKTLKLECNEKNISFSDNANREVTLFVPNGTIFNEVSIEFGAGEMIWNNLVAKEVKANLGAGSIQFDNAKVDEMKAEVGVGELVFKGAIEKELKLECSMGSVEATIAGSENDFNYGLECSLGNISLNGRDYTSKDQSIDNNAKKDINATVSMGSVSIVVE